MGPNEKIFHRLSALYAIAGMAGLYLPKKKNKLHGIDIEKEYQLIQQKKSRLSASMRRLVCQEYEKEQHNENNS